MCGIAGFCSNKRDQAQTIQRMIRMMRDRGPDGSGYWIDERTGVTLGHTRLAVQDLSDAGAQPMRSKDGRWVVSYNGEIYNFTKLRMELENERGKVKFCSASDTEVLVEAVAGWGIDKMLEKVRGMYAISLYDTKKRRLYLMRDCMGEKPIYYGYVNGVFTFASDLKAVRQMECFSGRLSYAALALYFKYGYIPAPYSIYEGIYKLLPGTVLSVDFPFTEYRTQAYWNLPLVAQKNQKEKFTGNLKEATDELECLLKKSVQDMLAADVPVGVFLSGGTDSSLVTALMQSLSEKPIHTFTVGFENMEWNEAKEAERTASYLGTIHTSIYLKEDEVCAVLPKMPQIYTEPFADNSQLAAYFISRETKKSVTVALCGDGGDELFAGYGIYRELLDVWNHRKSYQMLKNPDHKSQLYARAESAAQLKTLYYEYAPQLKQLLLQEEDALCVYDSLKQLPALDEKSLWMLMDQQQYLADDNLVKIDRAGMAVSLETRMPLLDRDIVEYSWKLPIAMKDDAKTSKKVLKEVLYRYLPRKMMERPKKGFNIPVAAMIRNNKRLREWAQELLRPEKIRQEGILRPDTVAYFWDGYQSRQEWRPVIWYLLMFEQWLQDV